jgi:tetratricopeptide (TPR) repeat protein
LAIWENKLILHPHLKIQRSIMAQTSQDQDFIVTEAIGKTEHFINQNRKSLSIIFGALLLAVGGYYFYQKVYVAGKEKEAQAFLFYSEQYLKTDSLKLAINGDGNHPGLEEIADEYSMSPSGNLAKYYLGMSLMKMKDYDKAIDVLRSYDAKDKMTGSLVYGAIGDANMELKKTEEAISFYNKACTENPNNFTTPIMMMKLALAQEVAGNYKEALDVYNRLKKDYATSTEAQQADKYIARDEAMLNK